MSEDQKRIFTDLDGLLIPELNRAAWREVLKEDLGFSTDMLTSEQIVDRLVEEGRADSDKKSGLIQEKRALMNRWYQSMNPEQLLFADSEYFLSELRRDRYNIYLVTTKNTELTQSLLKRLDLGQYFKSVGSGITSKKQFIGKYMGEKMFFTDSLADIEEVKGVGNLRSIVVTRGAVQVYSNESYIEAGAYKVVKTLSDALCIVRDNC